MARTDSTAVVFSKILLCIVFFYTVSGSGDYLFTQGDAKPYDPDPSNTTIHVGEASENRRLVVGGTATERGRYPYAVSLVDCDGKHLCGGSLIGAHWVLSAARCQGLATHAEIVRFNKNVEDDGTDQELIGISYEVTHPLYVVDLEQNDVLMIRLKEESSFRPVPMDDGRNLTAGTDVTVLGWGSTDPMDAERSSPRLREAEMDVVDNVLCAGAYLAYSTLVLPNTVCARRLLSDSCFGDEGGPLVLRSAGEIDGIKTDLLVGIVSFRKGCANPLMPTVHSRVSSHQEFVNLVIWQDEIMTRKERLRLRTQYLFERRRKRLVNEKITREKQPPRRHSNDISDGL